MAGFIPPEYKVTLLDTLSGGTTYLGLAHAIPLNEPPTLANISEVTVGGYNRVAVTWRPATIDGQVVKKTNESGVTIGSVLEDMNPAPYAFLTDAASGTTGKIRYIWELTTPVSAPALKPVFVPVDALIIE